MTSRRTREAGFLIAPALIGLLGAASVASAQADGLDLGPLPAAGAIIGVFVLMHVALRLLTPNADPYLLPLVGVFLAMLYLATGRVAYPATGLATFAVGSVLVYLAVPRIQDRVTGWLSPFDHPRDLGFQMVQSLYALGDGGIVGPGLGRGFLVSADGGPLIPELRTDFIFSAIASELGYVGAIGVLLVFVLVAYRGFVIAAQSNDGFSKLLAGGLTAVLAFQAFLIIAGIVRLVPLTGVTLPFMSYGGSSVVTNFGLIALLLVMSHRSRSPARTGGA